MNNLPPDKTKAAMERMELYSMAYPGSPSAVRRPQLLRRGDVWIAFVGASIPEGIAGFGYTVEAALRAFDVQYLRALRQPGPAGDYKNAHELIRPQAANPA